MSAKLSVKLLQHSDITLFRPYFEEHPKTKQKALNLNADVFVDAFYPTIRSGREQRYRVDLRIFGPGLSGEYALQRKILKEQKNWRLDGELVDNPPDEPERFDALSPGDVAIISFDGVIPDVVTLYVISAADVHDKTLHQELSRLVEPGRKSMREIDLAFLAQIILRANPDELHPIRDLLLEDALEDAAQNGIEGIRQLATRVSRRRITAETLQQARESASQIGRTGEEFANSYLTQLKDRNDLDSFDWVSNENAISPYDFKIQSKGKTILIDVKTTGGQFENAIHISYNELLQMQEASNYDLYRVYEVSETQAFLRIAHGMQEFARTILAVLGQLPEGVRPDSVSVFPRVLDFGEPIALTISDQED